MEKDRTWDPRKVSGFKVKDMIICLSISDRGDDMQERDDSSIVIEGNEMNYLWIHM